MKRKIILLVLFALLEANVAVMAQTPAVTVSVDYLRNIIDVSYSSELMYNTAVTFVLTRSDSENTPAEYIRIAEEDFIPGKNTECEIPIGEDISCREGEEHCERYKIYAVPGGLKSSIFMAESAEFVISCSEKQSELVVGINEKPEAEAFDNCKNILTTYFGMDVADSDSDLGKYIKQMQTDDYSGGYTNIGQLPKAWEMANVLSDINSAADNDSLKLVVTENSEILAIDENDVLYKMDTDGVYTRLFSELSIDKAYSLAGFTDKMNDSIAMSSFIKACNSDLESLDLIFERFSKRLGISDDDIESYRKLKSKNSNFVSKFVRQFDKYSKESTVEIADKFDSVLSEFENSKTGSQGGSSGGSSGGGSGSGGSKNNKPIVRGEENAYGGGSVQLTTSPNATNNQKPQGFIDLPENHWAYQCVTELQNYGVISGYTDGTFRPDAPVTRGEFIKLITEGMNINTTATDAVSFTDVTADNWVYPYVQRLALVGVIQGYEDGSCGVDKNISRQEAAVLVERALKIKNTAFIEAVTEAFIDESDIADYAKEAVKNLSAAEIISGFEDGRFMPKENLTRAQAAVIIYKAASR